MFDSIARAAQTNHNSIVLKHTFVLLLPLKNNLSTVFEHNYGNYVSVLTMQQNILQILPIFESCIKLTQITAKESKVC